MHKNHLVLFIINRYFNYGLLFIRGIILAKFLGPYYFGVWGFLTLLLQYFSFSNLGINYAVTVRLSTDTQSEKKDTIPSMALLTTAVLSIGIILVGLIIHSSGVSLFPRFEFDQYLILVVLIIALSNIQQILINIYRVKKGLRKIALVETISAIILLVSALVFHEGQLIKYQLFFMVFSGGINLLILCLNLPFKFQFTVDLKVIRSLFKIGLPLLIYNFCFYLITISARSIVNIFYSNEILGFYTLANSIAFAVMLGLQSVAWAIYPNVLTKTSAENNPDTVRHTINKINLVYNTFCFLLIIIVAAVLPLLFIFLPNYRPALPVITILLISQAVLSASFGYNSLAVARGQQVNVAKFSSLIVLFITITGLLCAYLTLDYVWVAVSVLLGALIYTLLQVYLGTNLLPTKNSFFREYANLLPFSTLFSFLLICVGSFSNYPVLFSVSGLLVFIFFNATNIIKIVKQVILNQDRIQN